MIDFSIFHLPNLHTQTFVRIDWRGAGVLNFFGPVNLFRAILSLSKLWCQHLSVTPGRDEQNENQALPRYQCHLDGRNQEFTIFLLLSPCCRKLSLRSKRKRLMNSTFKFFFSFLFLHVQ